MQGKQGKKDMQGMQGMQGAQDMKGGMSVEGLTSHLRSGLKIIYVNRDKVIILAAGATLIYYSIAAIREFLHLLEEVKGKYYETCNNAQLISDYFRGLKRCKRCNACYKNHKSFENHLRRHNYQDEFDRVMGPF